MVDYSSTVCLCSIVQLCFRTLQFLLLFALTTAHVGSFHSPDVGATQVTRLHHVHLVCAEPVIQRTIRLWRKMCRQFTGMQKKGNLQNKRKGHLAYAFVFFPPLLRCLGSLKTSKM